MMGMLMLIEEIKERSRLREMEMNKPVEIVSKPTSIVSFENKRERFYMSEFNDLDKNKKLLVVGELSFLLPKTSYIIDTKTNLISVGNRLYKIQVDTTQGLCDDPCFYTDDEDVENMDVLRLWKVGEGVLAINPQNIKTEEGGWVSMIIQKLETNIPLGKYVFFTDNEIKEWTEILSQPIFWGNRR